MTSESQEVKYSLSELEGWAWKWKRENEGRNHWHMATSFLKFVWYVKSKEQHGN